MSIANKWSHIRSSICALLALVLLGNPAAWAGLVPTSGDAGGPAADDFTYLGLTPTKWDPGENTASIHAFSPPAGPMTPGGATWSVMPAGTLTDGFDTSHGVAGTASVDVGSLTSGDEMSVFSAALDTWAGVSGFTNLGMRGDNGAAINTPEPGPGNTLFGDIRIGAYPFTVTSTLAHGYQPGTGVTFPSTPTIGGDIHLNSGFTWIDVDAGETGGFDLFSVALHEFGHALGLGHSADSTSVMFASIGINFSKRTLTADDIAGITALYGAAVPEPSSFLYLGLVACSAFVVIRLKWRVGVKQA